MTQRQPLPRGMLLLVLLSVGITFYFMFTYTGPFQWLAELQLKWIGQYEEKLTFLFTDLLVLAVLGLPFLIIKKLGIASAAPAGTTTDTTGEAPKRTIAAGVAEFVIIGLVGLGFAVAGVRAYYLASHAGPLTPCRVEDLEAGQKPSSLWIAAHGIAIPKAAVEFGESYSKDQFIPVISGRNDPLATGVHLFIKARASESVPSNGRDESDYQGYLSPADLPGPVRTIMEKQGVLKGADYYVLELNATPQKKIADAKIMLYVGLGIAFLGAIILLAKQFKKSKPAAMSASLPESPPSARA